MVLLCITQIKEFIMEVSFALKTAIELAQNGNISSFEFIYKETFSYAWSRASIIMNHNPDATGDIVQDAYIICYQRLSTLENIEAFYSWLSSIIYHLGMQYYRKQKRELLVNDCDSDWDELYSSIDINNSPELSIQEQATKEIVKELIETLPEVQKITLLAHYFDEMKIEQIANIMQCPESTVKSRLNYARISLRNAIEKLEVKHGYRIHVFSFPVLYYALKELLQEIEKECTFETSLFQNISERIVSNYSTTKDKMPSDENAFENSIFQHLAAISVALDSAQYITASLGISAVLTASLTGVLDIEPLDTFNILKIDFTSLITSLKTKFALASAATAIGNNELVLMQELNLPTVQNQTIEAMISGYLYDYDELFNFGNIVYEDFVDNKNVSKK